MKWTLLASVFALGSWAHAAPTTIPANSFDLSTLSQSSLFYIDALAPKEGDDHRHLPKACEDAKVTDDQKTKIREAVYQSETTKAQLEANLKVAFLNYGHTLADSTSTLTAAQTAEATLTDSISKMATNRIDLKNNILYNILTADQRRPALACMMWMERMRMERKLDEICAIHNGYNPPPGPHPGPGPKPIPNPNPNPTPAPPPPPIPTPTPAPEG